MFIQPQKQRKPLFSLSHRVLLALGFVLTAVGTIGTTVVQGGLLHLSEVATSAQLNELAAPGSPTFALVSISVACFAFGTFAMPVYAMLVVEGFRRTASFKNYLLRMLGFAVLTEIPFDLAYSGRILDLTQQNPLFAYCICLCMLYFLQKFDDGEAGTKLGKLQLTLIKFAIVVGGVFWVVLSQSLLGIYFVALCAVFWLFGRAGSYDAIYCIMAGVMCSVLRFPAPFGLFFVHWYDPEKGGGATGKLSKYLYYILYPVLLLACAGARLLLQ